MARVILIVLDSFGCGEAADAPEYGDKGADTFGHIAEYCALGRCDERGHRGALFLPHLTALGLGHAAKASSGIHRLDFADNTPAGMWGYGIEESRGKDTPSGHWEIVGTPVPFKWGYFPHKIPCFPDELIQNMLKIGHLGGVLANCHASGTQVINDFGEEHIRTGFPICYTSVDSVLQIAAHEQIFGLQRLYDLCKSTRKLCDSYNIGRVIARPFVGNTGDFHRTANRKDFAMPPPANTLLELAVTQGREVITIGKIGDIFAHRFTGTEKKGASNDEHFDILLASLPNLADGGLIFANFVDFDTEFGHRRDVSGYAACLEAFDARLPELYALLQPDDVVIFTADHGNDPTFKGTDHTREHVPILVKSSVFEPGPIGARGMADIGQFVCKYLKLPATPYGISWI